MTRTARPTTHTASSTRPFHRRLGALVVGPLVVAVVLLGAGGTALADPPVEAETAPAAEPLQAEPTAEELAAQRAEAERLAAEVENQAEALEAARKAIDDVTARLEAAVDAEQAALAAQAAAVKEQDAQLARLEAAASLVRIRQVELGRWASQTYRDGVQMGGIEDLMTLLESESSDDLSQRVVTLEHVGRWRGSVVDTVEEAEEVQQDAAAKAATAAEAATTAAGQAVAARQQAENLLDQQRGQVALLQALHASTEQAATEAGDQTEKMTAARLEAEQRRLAQRSGSRGDNQITGTLGSCTGGDVSSYPNGAIPTENLCPLWGGPGHRLRPDAAHAFNQLSEAYALELGRPICVTDSYRDYAGQVAVHAAKPHLAARPGTSNHGWGTAVDLCGGIQRFGTTQHQWMRANAPLYGFFHPTWAQQGGSRPEAWHWEYGG